MLYAKLLQTTKFVIMIFSVKTRLDILRESPAFADDSHEISSLIFSEKMTPKKKKKKIKASSAEVLINTLMIGKIMYSRFSCCVKH